VIAGQLTPQPVIVQTLQGFIGREQKVVDTKLAHAQAVKDRDDAGKDVGKYLDNLAVGLKAYYGETNPTLSKYGVPVKHPPAKLPADKLLAKADKAKATRTARGTKSKKQKKDIHGVVPAPAPTNGAGSGAPATPNKP
jgi:hypothetical protein